MSWLGVARGFGDCTICNKIIMDEQARARKKASEKGPGWKGNRGHGMVVRKANSTEMPGPHADEFMLVEGQVTLLNACKEICRG